MKIPDKIIDICLSVLSGVEIKSYLRLPMKRMKVLLKARKTRKGFSVKEFAMLFLISKNGNKKERKNEVLSIEGLGDSRILLEECENLGIEILYEFCKMSGGYSGDELVEWI